MSTRTRRRQPHRSSRQDLPVARAGEVAGGGVVILETVGLPYIEQRGAAPVNRPPVAPSQTKVIAS